MKFNSSQIEFVRQYIKSPIIMKKIDKACHDSNNNREICIQFTDPEKTILLDELTLLLTDIGLDFNDEPNAIGLQIEDLIDHMQIYKSN